MSCHLIWMDLPIFFKSIKIIINITLNFTFEKRVFSLIYMKNIGQKN